MDQETFKKAKILNERVDKLLILVRDLRPKFCHGVGVSRTHPNSYKYNFWVTHDSNTDDGSLLMKAGIQAMYDKACILLGEAKKELEEL